MQTNREYEKNVYTKVYNFLPYFQINNKIIYILKVDLPYEYSGTYKSLIIPELNKQVFKKQVVRVSTGLLPTWTMGADSRFRQVPIGCIKGSLLFLITLQKTL